MPTINQIRRCYNCGVILQCDDPNKEGYVKKETLESASQNFLFCDKCFEKERYRKRSNEPLLENDFVTLLNDAKKKQALIVYVVNLFSFEAAFNHQLNDILSGMNILVVANKFDLLPSGTKKDEIEEYVAHRFRAAGLQMSADKVIVASAFDDDTAREIMMRIYEMKNGKDVFIVGSHLSGKSTLLSSILRVFSNFSGATIVTEPYPNTNLDVMKIPFNKKSSMYNTPGLSIDNSILYNLDKPTFNTIFATQTLKERQIVVAKNQALLFGGLGFIELLSGDKTIFNCYFNDKVILKRLNPNRNPMDERFVKLIASKAVKPVYQGISSVKDLDVYEIDVNDSRTTYRDIGILGLGWINFKASNQIIRIYVPKGVSIYSSRPKINKK